MGVASNGREDGRDVLHTYGRPVPRACAPGLEGDPLGLQESLHGLRVGELEVVAECGEEDALVVADEPVERSDDVRRGLLLLLLALAAAGLAPAHAGLLYADGAHAADDDVRQLGECD